MAKTAINNVRLGTFVIAGFMVLVMILYMVGQNQHLFSASYNLKVQFADAQGLVEGNNVRFSGINVGSVKSIKIHKDAVIEVTMLIDRKMAGIIDINARASIGTEGLVGNKVINITQPDRPGTPAKDGDILASRAIPHIEDMMETLQGTNNDVAIIAAELKSTIQNINKSALWTLLVDERVPADLKISVAHIRDATSNAADLAAVLDKMAKGIQTGKGTIGMLLADTSLAAEMRETIMHLRSVSIQADQLVQTLNTTAGTLQQEISSGSGPAHLILKDSAAANMINASLDNIQKGAEGFYQNMEALKRNFFLRGYFRRQKKKWR